ncbi:hypothetical protein IW261DRAFT_1412784 [Armillaria novae-zelandiae]|uniref:Uncharacterized protein n=1 Tax=Armillaria novae-zelandiae TaxID=153914 RepID=A0AA39PU51_9AGAR|nr:hypothetical protein IW261DRAFT_1412784 [Armillaria novae-zelandiae]
MLLRLWTICFIAALYCFYMHKIYPDLRVMVPIHTYSLVTHTLPSIVGHRFAATSSVSVDPRRTSYSFYGAVPHSYGVASSVFMAGNFAVGFPEGFSTLLQLSLFSLFMVL